MGNLSLRSYRDTEIAVRESYLTYTNALTHDNRARSFIYNNLCTNISFDFDLGTCHRLVAGEAIDINQQFPVFEDGDDFEVGGGGTGPRRDALAERRWRRPVVLATMAKGRKRERQQGDRQKLSHGSTPRV